MERIFYVTTPIYYANGRLHIGHAYTNVVADFIARYRRAKGDPQQVFAHGWLRINGEKISKSRGNSVDPHLLIGGYGVDAVRYYLLREMPFASDGSYGEDALVLRMNLDLANDLGNLLSRTTQMINRLPVGLCRRPSKPTAFWKKLPGRRSRGLSAAARDSTFLTPWPHFGAWSTGATSTLRSRRPGP